MAWRLRNLDLGPIWIYLVSFGALFWRFGYNFGAGDQDEVVPLLLSLLDPELLTSDWFVQAQAAEIGVRTYVVWLLLPFCKILPIETVVFGVYLLSWILIGSGAYRLATRLVGSRVAAAATVFISLGVLHKWTLGSNDMVYSMFVGEMLAWGLGLHAIESHLRGRYRLTAVLLGVATWFQLLVGLLTAGLLVVERLWDRIASRRNRGDATASWMRNLTPSILFLVVATPSILPIAWQQFQALALDKDLVFYVLAAFRNPFHHLLFSFEIKSIVRFAALLVGGAAALHHLSRSPQPSEWRFVARLIVVGMAACAVTAIFTEGFPILLVAKLQAFKLTVLLKFLLLSMMAGAASVHLPDRLTTLCESWLRPGRLRNLAGVASFGIVIVVATVQPEPLRSRLHHTAHLQSAIGQLEVWARNHTEREALFAVPPSNSTFRSVAQRAIVVNYAAFPFNDAHMIDWYLRLLDMAPIDPPERGVGVRPALDAAFHRLSPEDWSQRIDRYGIDYVVIDRSAVTGTWPYREVFRAGEWTLYDVRE